MKETQRRIKEYQAKLPRVKEKVVAVMLLLAVSTSMLVTVSFAWVALSTNPEVTGVNTSIASNGNLEIALASGLMTSPNEVAVSAVGDSALPLLERNITWGNLINLSDPAYGLESLVLRPALLNEANLLEKPLHGPVYDESGRVIDTNTNFGYAALEKGVFEATQKLGIRAITSMIYGSSGEATQYNQKLNRIESENAKNQDKYEALANKEEYMTALASMMAGYMVESVFKQDPDLADLLNDATLKRTDLDQFVLMYQELIECFEEQANVYVNLLNLSAELSSGSETPPKITSDELLALSYNLTEKTAKATLLSRGFTTCDASATKIGIVEEIDQFLADYHMLVADEARLRSVCGQVNGSVKWKNSPTGSDGVRIIDSVIANFANVTSCTISGAGYNNLRVDKIQTGHALTLTAEGVICETKITNGILYRFDNRTGARIKNPDGKPLTMVVNVKLVGEKKITSNVSTTANANYFEVERAYVQDLINDKYGAAIYVAEDSYGFAIDFWVRTNAQGSYLTLQGNVLTEMRSIEVMGKDVNGDPVAIYTITVKIESESGEGGALEDLMTQTYDIYPSKTPDENGNMVDCWRYEDNHGLVSQEILDSSTPLRKIETKPVVIGYEGDNRVWEGSEHSILTVNSSTQGNGSCYVFYSENPVDQARIKMLLKSMKIAFVDDQGALLAKAYMATDLSYATTGKVIVPLVLDDESIHIGVDNDGNSRYAITALEQNVPKRITAIVYLDGEEVSNEHVLAAADIQGQMNIQFGSSVLLKALEDEKLYNSQILVDAELEGKTTFEYGTDEAMTTKVKVTIDGVTPSTVEAYFIRKINSTQGSPENHFILEDEDGDGVWEGTYTFLYPGEYILRSVQIDRIDRELQLVGSEQFPTVTVKGFSINSVTYSIADGANLMTDSSSYPVSVSLRFATNDRSKMPQKVVGQFLRQDGSVATVNFRYDPTTTTWMGTTNFVSSGEYTMQYVMLDGEYTELALQDRCTVTLTLGLRVKVQTTSPTTLIYGDASTPEALLMQVQILDNSGAQVPSLGRAELYYSHGGRELYTPLMWNNVLLCYEGEFKVESGIWTYDRVEIRMGSGAEETVSTLTTANQNAPVFTVIPPTPPSFHVSSGLEAQFLATDSLNASLSVSLYDSDAATVYGKIVSLINGEIMYVLGERLPKTGEAYDYSFKIERSGRWELAEIAVFNVFDTSQTLHGLPEDGNVDTEDEFKTGIRFGEADGVTRRANVLRASDITVNATYLNSPFDTVTVVGATTYGLYGKDAGGVTTSDFMASHQMPANSLRLTFTDSFGLIRDKVFVIENITCGYTYAAHDEKYGGYTTAQTQGAAFAVGGAFGVEPFTMVAASADGISGVAFTNSNAVTFRYAAQYTLKDGVSYTVAIPNSTQNSVNVTVMPNNVYSIEVWSKKPELKWTGVSPTTLTYLPNNNVYDDGSTLAGISGDEIAYVPHDKLKNGSNTISADGYSAEVFFSFGDKAETDCGKETGNYIVDYSKVQASKATATLYHVTDGNFSCSFTYTGASKIATMNGGSATYQAVNTFTFGKGKMSDTQAIGERQILSGQYGLADAIVRVVLGSSTLSVETITITYEGLDVQVKLDNALKLTNKY